MYLDKVKHLCIKDIFLSEVPVLMWIHDCQMGWGVSCTHTKKERERVSCAYSSLKQISLSFRPNFYFLFFRLRAHGSSICPVNVQWISSPTSVASDAWRAMQDCTILLDAILSLQPTPPLPHQSKPLTNNNNKLFNPMQAILSKLQHCQNDLQLFHTQAFLLNVLHLFWIAPTTPCHVYLVNHGLQ